MATKIEVDIKRAYPVPLKHNAFAGAELIAYRSFSLGYYYNAFIVRGDRWAAFNIKSGSKSNKTRRCAGFHTDIGAPEQGPHHEQSEVIILIRPPRWPVTGQPDAAGCHGAGAWVLMSWEVGFPVSSPGDLRICQTIARTIETAAFAPHGAR